MSMNNFRQLQFSRTFHPILPLCLLLAACAASAQADPTLSGFKHAVHNNRVYICWQEQGDFDAVRVLIRSADKQSATLVPWRNSARNHIWGPFDTEVLLHDGQKLDEYLDLANVVRQNPNRPYPFMRVYNGRQDPWMHWHFNPRFYRAMDDASLARLVCWSDKGHSGNVERIMGEPALVDFLSFYRHKPVIGFKDLDNAPNPGNGDKTDGDPIGVIGRGFSTRIVKDEKDSFEFVFNNESDIGHIALTPRRCQKFAVAPMEQVQCSLLDAERVLKEQTVSADDKGIVSVPLDFREFPNVQNAVVRLRRADGSR